jgi:hypothetical protein
MEAKAAFYGTLIAGLAYVGHRMPEINPVDLLWTAVGGAAVGICAYWSYKKIV